MVGRWKWRSRWSVGEEGMKLGSVCVTTRVGMYLNFNSAVCNDFGIDGKVERIDEDTGAGVARMICVNGPNVDVPECSV